MSASLSHIELADEGRKVAVLEELGNDLSLKRSSIPNQYLYEQGSKVASGWRCKTRGGGGRWLANKENVER